VRQGEPQYQSDVGYVADDRTAVGSHNATKYNHGKQHMSINVCTFSGRLGRDSEVKYIPSGTAVLEFSLAVDTGFGDKKSSFWIKCAMFGERCNKLSQYLLKGQQVIVSGEFSPREYQAGDGTTKVSLDLRLNWVELVGSKQDGGQREAPAPAPAPAARQQAPEAKNGSPFDDMDDSIPF